MNENKCVKIKNILNNFYFLIISRTYIYSGAPLRSLYPGEFWNN